MAVFMISTSVEAYSMVSTHLLVFSTTRYINT